MANSTQKGPFVNPTQADMEGPEVLGAAAANSASAIDANIKSKSTRVKPHALLQEAAQLKTEGNAFYQEKNVRSAIGRYHRALLVLRAIDTDVTMAVKGFGPEMPVLSPAQEEMLRKTQVDCYNNLAACLLQRPSVDYARVQEYSLRVLQWRPADIKALYRAGVATLELGDAQAAKQYLIQASRGQPNDANVRKHLQRAEEKLNQDLQREKAMYQGMFSTGSRTGLAEEVNQSNGTGGEGVHQLVTGVCQLNVANK